MPNVIAFPSRSDAVILPKSFGKRSPSDAAIEAVKLGRGDLSYIARVLSCDRHTIRQGLQELAISTPSISGVFDV